MKSILKTAVISILAGASFTLSTQGMAETASSFVSIPPTLSESADPNVMINLSVETPMQGAAYNDQRDIDEGGLCPGRGFAELPHEVNIGICYFPDEEYLGYFDPDKCYNYTSTGVGYFEPVALANNHACNLQWSGNFLNWATMSAIDIFRSAMTGGNRAVDTATETILERTIIDSLRSNGDSGWFPVKKISINQQFSWREPFSNPVPGVDPSTVSPYNVNALYIFNHGTEFDVDSNVSGNTKLHTNDGVRIKVCDSSAGLEDNCKAYGTNHKPEGLIQNNAHRMRFAVMSYLADDDNDPTTFNHTRQGGVLRSNMKYVGEFEPDTVNGGLMSNAGKEWDPADGTFILNPDPAEATNSLGGAVSRSGVINYINEFGAYGYKTLDPVGELFYECINYFKHRPTGADGLTPRPTPDFVTPAPNSNEQDNFPVIGDGRWLDPILYQCQKNFIIAINDANPWEDKKLPGTSVTTQSTYGYDWDDPVNPDGNDDWGPPQDADGAINVTDLTNTVGELQWPNIATTGVNFRIGCVPGQCDMQNTPKDIFALGEAFGTAPGTSKENSYYVAGLSYYANTFDLRSGTSPTGVNLDGRQTVKTFMIDTQEYIAPATPLNPNGGPLLGEQNMLWLTGKYGGFTEINFEDTNGDGNVYEPDLQEEWDADGDGEPDNYVLASAPERLVSGLQQAFLSIDTRASAGSAAAVVANSGSGIGQVVQALYQPKVLNENDGQQVTWTGLLHSLFIDDRGLFREDSNRNNALDGYDTDMVVSVYFDTNLERARAKRSKFNEATGTFSPPNPPLEEDAELTFASARDVENATGVRPQVVNSIWNARDELAKLNNANIGTQRNYATQIDASNTRYIFTGLDTNLDGVITSTETFDFVASNIDSTNYRFFDIQSAIDETPARDVVRWVRGENGIVGMRNREIDIDDGDMSSVPLASGDLAWPLPNANEIWRLGDMVHSTPIVVGAPSDGYSAAFGDDTYETFRSTYQNRRQVVYIGANDGMLHAFNAGFWDDATTGFVPSLNGETAHPLGSELWAYVPGNLVPHLQWLTDPSYNHIYYVDGPPVAYDVNIFSPDTTHPNGWGTILVVGMRLGGSPINVDTDGNGSDDYTGRSAYIILDVTDPESPPQLIAEITHPALGLTTSRPTVVKNRAPTGVDWTNPSSNEWYLVFGSGPDDLTDATSSQNAQLFMFDLNNNTFVTGFGSPTPHDIGVTNSFVGDLQAGDWDVDFVDDAVYFGTIGDTLLAPTGTLQRLRLDNNQTTTLIDPGQPFVSRPNLARDTNGDLWVHAGTGRLLTKQDSLTIQQQSFYGIKEPKDSNGDPTYGTVAKTDLQDVTDVQVFADGTIEDPGGVLPAAVNAGAGGTFDDLQDHIEQNTSGWYFDFAHDGINPSTRNVNAAAQVSSLLIFTEYTPNPDICQPEGNSELYVLDFTTGVASPHGALGEDTLIQNAAGENLLETKADLGQGLASEPAIHHGAKKPGAVTIITQQSTAALTETEATLPPAPGGRESWRELELQ